MKEQWEWDIRRGYFQYHFAIQNSLSEQAMHHHHRHQHPIFLHHHHPPRLVIVIHFPCGLLFVAPSEFLGSLSLPRTMMMTSDDEMAWKPSLFELPCLLLCTNTRTASESSASQELLMYTKNLFYCPVLLLLFSSHPISFLPSYSSILFDLFVIFQFFLQFLFSTQPSSFRKTIVCLVSLCRVWTLGISVIILPGWGI